MPRAFDGVVVDRLPVKAGSFVGAESPEYVQIASIRAKTEPPVIALGGQKVFLLS